MRQYEIESRLRHAGQPSFGSIVIAWLALTIIIMWLMGVVKFERGVCFKVKAGGWNCLLVPEHRP